MLSASVMAQARLNKIMKSGELKVGITGTQPPFSVESKKGDLMGFEVDLANLLAESMGVGVTFVRLPFGDLLGALESGKADAVMSGMTITIERNLKAAFVGPSVVSGKSF